MGTDVVMDTNVLLSALRATRGASYRLLSMVGNGGFRLHLSTPLVAEYESVLKRGSLALTAPQIDDVVDYLCAHATHHQIYYLWRPVLKDPGDDFVLELAVKAQARIVTWNLADFKRAAPLGIEAQNPRDFLHFLEGEHP